MMNPARIARIGVAVEMSDGSRHLIFSDSPGAEIDIETTVEHEMIPGDPWQRPRIIDHNTSITISGLRAHAHHRDTANTTQALDSLQRSIEGNPAP